VDPGRRRELTRFGAPLLFLLGVTIAVLLIKAGLDSSGSEPSASTPTAPAVTTRATTTGPKLVLTGTTPGTTTTPGARYYEIQSGDTLGAIAAKYNTTVDQLLTLNPDVDPNALHPGDRIRVG
jgi:LysM repeat protein